MKNEIEATFLSINKDLVRNKLKKAGFRLKTPEHLMRRKTFDFSHLTPALRLINGGVFGKNLTK